MNVKYEDTLLNQTEVAPAPDQCLSESSGGSIQCQQNIVEIRKSLESVESNNIQKLRQMYINSLQQVQNLGNIIQTYNPEFGQSNQMTKMFEGESAQYPTKVKAALIQIVQEYNEVFGKILESTKRTPDEYQYCDGKNYPTSIGVQIDMVALPQEVLDFCSDTEVLVEEISTFLKGCIFEIENNLAGYTFLGAMSKRFKEELKATIQNYKEKTGKGVYILTTTGSKYNSIAEGEFGKNPDSLYDQKVLAETGFHGVISPDRFVEMSKNGEELPLFYVRCSLDTGELKKPGQIRTPSLLDNPEYVKIIRENTITPNVDYPYSEVKTNDTKAYMEEMGLGMEVSSIFDVVTNQYYQYLKKANVRIAFEGEMFAPKFVQFCLSRNIDIQELIQKNVKLRGKPNNESYGCYGHIREVFGIKFLNSISKEIEMRGSYIIQPELQNMEITNTFNDQKFVTIDRNFDLVDNEGVPTFIQGYRSNIPTTSNEAKKNNIHGNNETIYTLIN